MKRQSWLCRTRCLLGLWRIVVQNWPKLVNQIQWPSRLDTMMINQTKLGEGFALTIPRGYQNQVLGSLKVRTAYHFYLLNCLTMHIQVFYIQYEMLIVNVNKLLTSNHCPNKITRPFRIECILGSSVIFPLNHFCLEIFEKSWRR